MSQERSGRRTVITAAIIAATTVAFGVASASADSLGSPPPTAAVAACSPWQLPVPSGWGGEVMDLNDSGVYIGAVNDGTEIHAAFWTPSARGYELHLANVPSGDAELLDINASGVASGFAYDSGQGFVYDTVTGAYSFLPDYAGGSQVWPRRINDHGVIAGGAYTADGTEFATTWAPPYTTPTRVHVPNEEQALTWTDPSTGQVYNWVNGSESDGINNVGTVTAFAGAWPDQHYRRMQGHSKFSRYPGTDEPRNVDAALIVPVARFADGRTSVLQTAGDQAYTFAVSDNGTVIGDDITDPNAFVTRPVYWKGGAEHDLGLPADAADGRALNVNGNWVTGGIDYAQGTASAYVWTGAGALQTLPLQPGFSSSWAHGVNQKLRVVAGQQVTDSGQQVPTVWQCPTGFTTR